MSKHFHFDLGNLPMIMWPVIIMVIAMGTGKFFEVSWLFKLGIFGFGAIVILVLLALADEFFY